MRAKAGSGDALARLRKCCLSLPEASEADSFGHPNFRAGKRTFAAFEWIKNRPSIAIRLDADAADALLLDRKHFFATPYGRGLWISLWADGKLDWPMVAGLIDCAYRQVALKRMVAALDSRPSKKRQFSMRKRKR